MSTGGRHHTREQLDEETLRRLLEVGRALVADLDVESVLRQVLETARELTEARYAALGILDEGKGELARFLTAGVDDETRREIGPPPRGRGVLGVLIRDPRPLRLHDVAEHPHSYGFPPGHPRMSSFLGVPIMIRGEAFGNLYLTDKPGGEFSEADEESVLILAEWAAVAIENAGLYQEAAGRRAELERAVRGLEATATIARAVGFETDIDRVLELIAKRGRALVDAQALLILLEERGALRVAACAGEAPATSTGARVPIDGTLAGSVLATGGGERVPSLADRVSHGLEAIAGDATSAIVVPLGFRGRARGVLVALDRAEGPPVPSADDQHLLTSFAASASIAIATAQSVEGERLRHSIMSSEAERRRWARELHDETLQELSALKLLLESARSSEPQGSATDPLEQAVEQLQLTIAGLQGLITELRPAALDELGVKPAVEALVARTKSNTGLDVEARIELAETDGRRSSRLRGDIESAVYRLVQEALTNAAKHSGAERAWVEIIEDDGKVTVTVSDDGGGFDPQARSEGFGLIGMRERVDLVNGRLLIDSARGKGTVVRAEVPALRDHESGDTAGRRKAG